MPSVITPFEWRLRSFLHRRPDDLGGAIERKNPICFFYRCYYDSINLGISRRDVGASRKTSHEEEINFPSEIYFLPSR